MNFITSAQDVNRCEFCDENMVDMLCVVCPLKLCKACVGNHLCDDPGKHKIVKYHERNTALVDPTCLTHSTERCKHYCQECEEAVCPSCITSNSHKKHIFLKISEIFNTKKEKINNDLKELEEDVFPTYERIVQQVESDAAILEEGFKILKQSIENQRTKWHDEIEKIANMLQNEADEMRDLQLKALNKHMRRVKELRTGIQEAIRSNKALLHSSNITEALSYKSQNLALKCLPGKPEIPIPMFVSLPINGDLIANMFGNIEGFSISKSKQIEGYKQKTQTILKKLADFSS